MTEERSADVVALPAGEEAGTERLDALLAHASRATLRVADAPEEVDIPEAVFETLRRAVYLLARDRSVRIVAMPDDLSLEEAAPFLNLPPQLLAGLIASGRLPAHSYGAEPRVRREDLLRYREAMGRERRRALAEIVELSEGDDLYNRQLDVAAEHWQRTR